MWILFYHKHQSIINQELKSRNIAGDFHTNFTFHLGLFSIDYGVLANANLHGIKTDLSGFTNLMAMVVKITHHSRY